MNKKKTMQRLFAIPFGLWAALFVVLPLLFVLWHGLTGEGGRFSLVALRTALEPEYMQALGLSMELALISTVVCLLLYHGLYPGADDICHQCTVGRQ